ncbi:MAG: hypothetical protein JKY82_10860 [Rhizobiaceae bacterium]|nr:hypothetical protein [Rhizobiaceae bacterium]
MGKKSKKKFGNKTKKPWKKDFEELDIEIVAAQTLAHGGFMAPVAIALALLDSGAISKKRLLLIIESLSVLVKADYEGRFGEAKDAVYGLEFLGEEISGSKWTKGGVVELLHIQEQQAYDLLQRRLKLREQDQK